MLINTALFGPFEVEEQDIYHLKDGLLGFDGVQRYALIVKQEEDVTLRWFQAAEHQVPCFVVFDPFEIINGYAPQVEPYDLKALGCDDPGDLEFLVIAVVPEDITKTTVNLKSPIALHRRTGKGRQVILANKDYPIRFSLSEEPEEEPPRLKKA